MASRLIFGGVDGTGDFFTRDYEPVFANSHVNILAQFWNEGPSHYRRGPWWQGDWTWVEANRIYAAVKADWDKGADAIFLAGYSRGGAAVIEISKWLKADGIPVECLVLLDPVDRTRTMGDDVTGWRDTAIVDTVKRVIYAKRSPAALSRESFGNCGKVRIGGSGHDRKKTFFCTHGGVGGTPWTKPIMGVIDEGWPDGKTNVTVPADRSGAADVQKWVVEHLFEAISDCKARLAKPAGPVDPKPGFSIPGQSGAPHLGGKQRIHVVVQGDWLSKIALKYYGDAMKYKVIHQANLKVIGPNPDIIKPGQRLVIP
jgi:LysM repeat protein